jgi:AbrB family looped-hinge helix DNA binding protein
MTKRPNLEDAVEDSDPVGDFDTRTLQGQGRVAIPSEYRDHLDLEIGDSIMVVCKEDGVKVIKATADKLKDL